MDYGEMYNNLIGERLINKLEKSEKDYTELHHIIPTSFGGSDEDSNKVRLTGEEHYQAHYYLYESYEKGSNDRYMAMCCYMAMTVNSTKNNRDFLIDAKEYQKIREEYREELENRGLIKVLEIINFIKINKHNPREDNTEDYERNLAYVLGHLRQSKKGNRQSQLFFNSYQKLAEENDMEDLFETRDYHSEAEDMAKEICEWITENHIPKGGNKTPLEKKYAKKIARWKSVRDGKDKKGLWDTKIEDIFKSYGYEECLYSMDEKEDIKVSELLDYVKENGFPKQKGDSESMTNYNFINVLRKKKSNNKLRDSIEILLEEVESYK